MRAIEAAPVARIRGSLKGKSNQTLMENPSKEIDELVLRRLAFIAKKLGITSDELRELCFPADNAEEGAL